MKMINEDQLPTYKISRTWLPKGVTSAIDDVINFGDQIVEMFPEVPEVINQFSNYVDEIKEDGNQIILSPFRFLYSKARGVPTCCAYIHIRNREGNYSNRKFYRPTERGLGYTRCPMCIANDRFLQISNRMVPWNKEAQSHPYYVLETLRGFFAGHDAVVNHISKIMRNWEEKFEVLERTLEVNGHILNLEPHEKVVGYIPTLVKSNAKMRAVGEGRIQIINLNTYEITKVAKITIDLTKD